MNTNNEFSFTFAGNGSYSNRGCEAIVRGTTTILRQQFGSSRYISNYFASDGCLDAELEADPDIIHRPFVLPKRYSPGWIEEQFSRRVLGRPYNISRVTRDFNQSLQQSNAVLLLGGDNYSLDYGDVDIHFSLLEMALDSEKPTAIWGASIGPFKDDPGYEQYASKILQQVPLICARETETIKYLASIGVAENVCLAADPAFYLSPFEAALPEHLHSILSGRCLGINLSPLMARYLGSVGFDQSSMDSWQRTATEIVENVVNMFSEPILLIPHVTADSSRAAWRDDYLLLNRVAEELSQTNRVHVIPPDLNASQTKWVIGQVALFAGARTHSTLAAISSNVPTIFIGYSMKARGLAQDAFGHLDWLIDGRDLVSSPSLLAERLAELAKHEEAVHKQLENKNPIFRERAIAAATRVADLVASYE
jgi:polysaccharide pyruvyl transferase WcaK-like protein